MLFREASVVLLYFLFLPTETICLEENDVRVSPRQGWLGLEHHNACVLSRIWLFATPQSVAHHAPLSMGFSRQEYWSGLPFPSPGDLPDSGMEHVSLHCRQKRMCVSCIAGSGKHWTSGKPSGVPNHYPESSNLDLNGPVELILGRCFHRLRFSIHSSEGALCILKSEDPWELLLSRVKVPVGFPHGLEGK